MKFIRSVLQTSLIGAALLIGSKSVLAENQSQMHMGDAPLHIMKAWVRPTVNAQTSTGGYLQVMAHADGKIVGVSSTLAKHTELHEMQMDGDVMRMRKVESIDVEEGDIIRFEPGGYHVMFMGLSNQLVKDQEVNFELSFQHKDGSLENVPVTAKVNMTGVADNEHHHAHGHGHH